MAADLLFTFLFLFLFYLLLYFLVNLKITQPDVPVLFPTYRIASADGNLKMTIPSQPRPPEKTWIEMALTFQSKSAERLDLALFVSRSVIALRAALRCRTLPLCLALDVMAGKVSLPAVPQQIC